MKNLVTFFSVLLMLSVVSTVGYGADYWVWSYGGNSSDYANSIKQTSDGGYIIAGSTRSFGAGEYDEWILKLDPEPFVSE